jgi:thioredoxin 1
MSQVKAIRGEEFAEEVLKSGVPVLVDFYATWCGPCQMLAPVLEELATEFEGRVAFRKVNVEEAYDLASQFNIRGVPTLIFFKEGKAVDMMVGFASAGALRRKLEEVACGSAALGGGND